VELSNPGQATRRNSKGSTDRIRRRQCQTRPTDNTRNRALGVGAESRGKHGREWACYYNYLELEVNSVRAGQNPEVGTGLKRLVLARTAARYPPLPRLEEPVASATPRTAAPATPDRVITLPQKPRSPVAEQSALTNPPEARTPPIEQKLGFSAPLRVRRHPKMHPWVAAHS
jgi:hypothetical protein